MRRVSVSNLDQTSGYLGTKLVAGSGITLTPTNPSVDATLVVASTGGADDHLVKATVSDATPAPLQDKLSAADDVYLSAYTAGPGYERLEIKTNGRVRCAYNDNAFQFLEEKLVAGSGVALSTVDKGGGNLGVQINANKGIVAGPLAAGVTVSIPVTTSRFLLINAESGAGSHYALVWIRRAGPAVVPFLIVGSLVQVNDIAGNLCILPDGTLNVNIKNSTVYSGVVAYYSFLNLP